MKTGRYAAKSLMISMLIITTILVFVQKANLDMLNEHTTTARNPTESSAIQDAGI